MDLNEIKSLPNTAEIYFLIQNFLSSGPLKRTLQVINEELEEHKILPKRIDWEGNQHERTVEDMGREYSNIRPDYLMQLCYQGTGQSSKASTSENKNSFLSLKKKSRSEKAITDNFNQIFNYVTRYHGAPIHDVRDSFNIVNCIRGREVSGPVSRKRQITPDLYTALQLQRITIGHLSAVYCLLFDHSGRFIITGADDLLLKIWSTYTGRLIASLRGASSEITDVAVNLANTLVAAGSIDRILRVWSMQTGTPIAVLTGHNGSVTSVNFCPTSSWGLSYLVSTSSDGSVAFWTYTHEAGHKVDFRTTPTIFQEKIRPGQAQMICSSFSPGGTFLVTGSADHHVRIYYMKGDEGPHRILEVEAHTDRVDSIQWAHSGLKFLSGSKGGTAMIWVFERQQWKSTCLNMTTKLADNTSVEDSKKLKVTMVSWNLTDTWVITAVSDYSLKVWDASNGQLLKVLTGHTDEVYVLESHPHDSNVILSAGHDGQLFVWNLKKGEIISRYLNTIEGQGYGAVYDAKWSPDGLTIAASDSHGHILTFGFGNGSILYEQLPKELFFHTDYRPLVRDDSYYVLDEQTQVPPHLMPPPFLVDIDGNPYPPMLQRLVPGREQCKTEQLVPNIVIGNEGTQEVIQDIQLPLLELDDEEPRANGGFPAVPARRERFRHNTGDWQSDPNMEWKRNVFIPTLKLAIYKRSKEIIDAFKVSEIEEYQRQLKLRPHMICTSLTNNKQASEKKKAKPRGRRRRADPVVEPVRRPPEISESSSDNDANDSSGYSDWMAEEGVNLQPPKRSKRRQVIHETSEESDGKEDDGDEEEEDEDDDNDHDHTYGASCSSSSGRRRVTKQADKPKNINLEPSTSRAAPKISKKKTEQYRISEWLSETRPRKSPYYPQMGDEVVYFVEGHQLYLEMVTLKNAYEINTKELPWNKMVIRDHEFAKVIGIQYEIKPPRLCCLRLAIQNEEGKLTGNIFTVKFHDMPDVVDFFVLKQTYGTAVSRNWLAGDKFRCMIDDGWWIGDILEKSPASEHYPHSSFLCYQIKWQNGEQERMSPWDFEPIDENRMPINEHEALPVLEQELNAILYKTVPEDWPNCDRNSACQNILSGITEVMQLAIAEPFLVPVDLSIYPSYAFVVEYPVDLSTIKARIENKFYRRLTAAQFDIRYLATNAEKFNQRHSTIVKSARIITELCLRIVKDCNTTIDVQAVYHQLVDTYTSSDTEEEVQPSGSQSTSDLLPKRSPKDVADWKYDVKVLLDNMWNAEESVPFRTPVNPSKYPDYQNLITHPMDLGTIKDKVENDRYDTPEQFRKDVKLIFRNSRTYNTNKKSRIYIMTVKLAASFEKQIKRIISDWKEVKNREGKKDDSSSDESSTSMSTSFNNSEDSCDKPLRTAKMSSDDSDSDDLPLRNIKSINKSTENDSTSQELDTETHVDVEHNNPNSEEDYQPPPETSTSKKYDTDSEIEQMTSDPSTDDSDSDILPIRTSLRKRPLRKKAYMSSSESDENRGSKRKKRKRRKSNRVDSDEGGNSGENGVSDGNGYFSTVSSRGRVRKLTPRAMALMKKH